MGARTGEMTMNTKMTYSSTYRGITATRTSAKPYAFAVWGRRDERAEKFGVSASKAPFVWRWTTRKDLAEREASAMRSWGYVSDVAVVEVVPA